MSFAKRAFTACATAAFVATAAAGPSAQKPAPAPNFYSVANLVSNGSVPTPYVDPNMVNTWGVSFNPTGLVWVTNNRSGTSTLYDGLGVVNPLVVVVPPAAATGTGSPTGVVFSGSSDFAVTNGTVSGPSRFIFASNDGLISGWAPNVDLHNAIRVVTTPGANYMGLAVASSATGMRLYATDTRNGRVDMFDSAFRKVASAGAFVDASLPKGLLPFGIQTIANQVYVTYARDLGTFGISGSGSGGSSGSSGKTPDSVIDVFDSEGRFLRRAAADIGLKQPWGVALAPANFGTYSNRLLVADFHDGSISAYDAAKGTFVGYLSGADGKPLKVPGLWGIQFGNGVNSQPTNTLFFGAGPNGQGGGVYGSVTAARP